MKKIAMTASIILLSSTIALAGSKIGGNVVNQVKAKNVTAIAIGAKNTAAAGSIVLE